MLNIELPEFEERYTSPCPRLYVDLDDTLSNFLQYFSHKFLKDIKAKRMTVDEISASSYFTNYKIRSYINKRIANQKIDFWSRIPRTKSGLILWNGIKKHRPYILTGVLPNDITMEMGKIKWCRRHLGFKNRHSHRILINKNRTSFAIGDNGVRNILIDDSIHNCNAWEAAGGIAYLFVDNSLVVDRIVHEVEADMQRHIRIDFMMDWNFKKQRYCF